MLVGHAGIALAAKAAAPRLPLAALLVAALAVDMLGCGLEVSRVPQAAAIAHSLPVSAGLALVFFLLCAVATASVRLAALLALVAFSHWPLDWLVHEPDLPLWGPDGPRVGLGLWRTPAVAVGVEFGIAAAGLAVYLLRRGSLMVAGLMLLAAVPSAIAACSQAAYRAASPSAEFGLALGGLIAMAAFIAAAAWADRRRKT